MKPHSAIVATVVASSAAALGSGVGDMAGGTGDALACALAGMSMVLASASNISSLTAARAIAAMVVSTGLGNVAVGLPHTDWKIDPDAFSNITVLSQNLMMVSIRGALRIGFPALVFASALGGRSRSWFGIIALTAYLLGLHYAGGWLIGAIPESARSSFSKVIMAAPGAAFGSTLESWGGALATILGLFVWAMFIWRDALTVRLGFWGVVAGGVALPIAHMLGSMMMSKSDWLAERLHVDMFKGFEAGTIIEILFGCIWAGIFGWVIWLNRESYKSTPDVGSLRLPWEVGLLILHTVLMLAAAFAPGVGKSPIIDSYEQPGVIAIAIPFVCVLTGRRSPWLLFLPVVMAPVIGIALRHGVYETHQLTADMGWTLVVAVPLAGVSACAVWAMLLDEASVSTQASLPIAVALIVETVALLWLAAVLLGFAWPWLRATPYTATLSLLMGSATILCLFGARDAMASSASSGVVPSTNGF